LGGAAGAKEGVKKEYCVYWFGISRKPTSNSIVWASTFEDSLSFSNRIDPSPISEMGKNNPDVSILKC
jgi:hypothetical protein